MNTFICVYSTIIMSGGTAGGKCVMYVYVRYMVCVGMAFVGREWSIATNVRNLLMAVVCSPCISVTGVAGCRLGRRLVASVPVLLAIVSE